MKARAVAIVDFNGLDFKTAAAQQEKLEALIQSYVEGNKNIVYHQVDMKERRGDNQPDITKLKFRNS